jgi:hypothetical protein
MNRDLALLIRTHGDDIWPFVQLLSRWELEGKNQPHLYVRAAEVDFNYLTECAESQLLKYERVSDEVKIVFEENNWPLYRRKPETPKVLQQGTGRRFVGLSIYALADIFDPLNREEYSSLQFPLQKLQSHYSDDFIMKLAEANKTNVNLRQFVTAKVFKRLADEYNESQKAKLAASHRGDREYQEWK